MKLDSLAFRLFATAMAWTVLALPLAGFLVYSLYRQETVGNYNERLSNMLIVMTADSLDHGGATPGRPTELGEPLFSVARSGYYWQITPLDGAPGDELRSVSLGDRKLPLPSELGVSPDAADPNQGRWADLEGPFGEQIRVSELVRSVGEWDPPRRYSFIIANDVAWLDRRLEGFRNRLFVALALVGLGLMGVTWLQVHFGLAPLTAIEHGLAAIRTGNAQRLEGELPAEIVPLQHEINALITSNEEVIDRARTQVGNLAHALKTPLAVITNEAREVASAQGVKIVEQADLMRRQMGFYLDRARVAAGVAIVGRVTEVEPVAAALVRVLTRINRDRDIVFEASCADGVRFAGERQDLEEMLGNLLDNAGKWAKRNVRLEVRVAPPVVPPRSTVASPGAGRRLLITIEDDGPGLTAEQIAASTKRGLRFDETKPGSGLGLNIVADLAQSYRGELRLSRSALGGLSAMLELPSA